MKFNGTTMKPTLTLLAALLLAPLTTLHAAQPPMAPPAKLPTTPAEVADLIRSANEARLWHEQLGQPRSQAANDRNLAVNALRNGPFKKAGGWDDPAHKALLVKNGGPRCAATPWAPGRGRWPKAQCPLTYKHRHPCRIRAQKEPCLGDQEWVRTSTDPRAGRLGRVLEVLRAGDRSRAAGPVRDCVGSDADAIPARQPVPGKPVVAGPRDRRAGLVLFRRVETAGVAVAARVGPRVRRTGRAPSRLDRRVRRGHLGLQHRLVGARPQAGPRGPVPQAADGEVRDRHARLLTVPYAAGDQDAA